MTAGQYQRLEYLLGQAELVMLENPPITPQGKKIQDELRAVLRQVCRERFRTEHRELADTPQPLDEVETLRRAAAAYRALIGRLTTDCVRLRELRKGKPDGTMVSIDELLAVKERTIASLSRCIEITELQIEALAKSLH